MEATVSIFYSNSEGFISQWKGKIIEITETSISIRFSKNKALKFRLKDLDIDFCLVTKTCVKNLGVSIVDSIGEVFSFDESVKEKIKQETKGNVSALWENGKWVSI